MRLLGCGSSSPLQAGSKVVVKTHKAFDNHRRVQIGESAFAKVDDVECDDLFLDPDAEVQQY